jgi:hypothetical protein
MQPFADSHEANLNINLDGLEVAKYMAFAPKLKDEVKSGLVDTRLNVGFRQEKDKQDLYVSGTIALRDADVQTHAGAPLVKAGRLAVDLDRMEPLAHKAHVKSIELDGFGLLATRRRRAESGDGLPAGRRATAPAKAPAAAPAAAGPGLGGCRFGRAGAAQGRGGAVVLCRRPHRDQGRETRVCRRTGASGPGKLDIGPVNVDIANLASTGTSLPNSMPRSRSPTARPSSTPANWPQAGHAERHAGNRGRAPARLLGVVAARAAQPVR